jgi:hypothetical protein
MREITAVKHYQKTEDDKAVDHVVIKYHEDDKEIILHKTARAAPEFYRAFDDLSPHVCQIGEFAEHEKDRTRVSGMSVAYHTDKEGNKTMAVIFTAKRRLVASPQPLTFNTPAKYDNHPDPDQKMGPECLILVRQVIAAADEYIDGKREQVTMDLPTSEPD